MTFKEIRSMSGNTQTEFAERYNVSLDAVKSWESDPNSKRYRKCPDSTLLFLEMAVRKDLVRGQWRTYFNTETHKVIHTDADMIYPYVSVSEDMAYVMRHLCEKGYIVTGSCAGGWNYDSEDNGEEAPAIVEYPTIAFADGIHLPSIPDRWRLTEDDTSWDADEKEYSGYWAGLIADVSTESESVFTKEKLLAILSLISWAESLDDASLPNL